MKPKNPMNQNGESFLRRAHKDRRGQTLLIVALSIAGLLGMAALTFDIGAAVVTLRALQASTDAAALAGAQALPGNSATTNATLYSSVLAADYNYHSNWSAVTMVSGYPKVWCSTTLTTLGIACISPANANAIQVKQQVTAPMFFAGVLPGVTLPITLTATSTASMRGAATSPFNVAIIIDTTASMSDTDSDPNCMGTRLSCALAGIQVLLHDLSPCAASEASCGTVTLGNVANSVDRVSLFTFPNVTVGTASKDYTCPTSSPTIPVYSFPTAGAATYAPTGASTPTYEVVGFSSDYRVSDTATTLSATSNLVEAVGGKSGCAGVLDPGGDGTYYAGVLYAAQSALVAEKALNPGSQNVIIILSDGDASASCNSSTGGVCNPGQPMAGASTTSGLYPSTIHQCQQAVTAAHAATAAGTRVYAVAYGSPSSGCSTDSGLLTPCTTMAGIASTPGTFYSDYTATGSGSCSSPSQPTSSLNQIFTQIAGDLTVARLIPDNTP